MGLEMFFFTISRVFVNLWLLWDRTVCSVTFFVFDVLNSVGWEMQRRPCDLTKGWLFVHSPTDIITLNAIYLMIIAWSLVTTFLRRDKKELNGVRKSGPAWLKQLVVLHNFFLIILSAYMCLSTVRDVRRYGYSLWGNTLKQEDVHLAEVLHIFYLSKIYEFMDTFIMLLKGNVQQASFLHVYHHVSASVIWWYLVRSYPGGDTYFACALNGFVHTIMYTYYLLAVIAGQDPVKRKQYLWWGKYLTLFQMTQFVLIICQATYCYFVPGIPKFFSYGGLLYVPTLLCLFLDFYYGKYSSSTRRNKSD